MPSIDRIASSTNGRRNLLQLAVAVMPGQNEMAFFICAKSYQASPTKTKALLIHSIFLQNAHTGLVDARRFSEFNINKNVVGVTAYNTYKTRFGTSILQPLATARTMPLLVRKLTSAFRKAPSDLFNPLLQPIRNMYNDTATDQFFTFAKEAMNGWREGVQGGGADREQGMYRKIVTWSKDLSKLLNAPNGFNASTLGVTNAFSADHLQ